VNNPAPQGETGVQRFSFKKADRILKRSEFVELSSAGRAVRSDLFIAVVLLSRGERSRLGLTVSRKVGGAVVRNRIKRLAREHFRLNQRLLQRPMDINLIARKAAGRQSNQAIFQALQKIFAELSGD
jgi:ribonuclease P protein component